MLKRSEILLIIDTLNPLSITNATDFSTFLSSLLLGPHISLLTTYHTDIPVPSTQASSNPTQANPYAPNPLTTLLYLSTSILRIYCLSHEIARKKARDRSIQEPVFGLAERREGILVGLQSTNQGQRRDIEGLVVQMEVRRKSGRGIMETFVLLPVSGKGKGKGTELNAKLPGTGNGMSAIILLDEHPLYVTAPILSGNQSAGVEGENEGEEVETTFNLSLTDKQKRDREGVVLPYFDAQREGGAYGAGEGGRILYEMGAEDREDFDDEEDEI